MPISTNAPFNEFGNSMILRDIEQLYLAMNDAGSGSPGDGQTQDQSEATSQYTGGLPDLSGLATTSYVDQVAQDIIDQIPTITYPISIANGGTAATTAAIARSNLGINALGTMLGTPPTTWSVFTSGSGTFTVPAGIYSIFVILVGAAGGSGPRPASSATTYYVASSSGGSPTTVLYTQFPRQDGGNGAVICGWVNDVTSTSVGYSVGSAGTNGSIGSIATPGTNGGDSYITIGSRTLTAGGGKQGVDYAGGAVASGGIPSLSGANNQELLLCQAGACSYLSGSILTNNSGGGTNTLNDCIGPNAGIYVPVSGGTGILGPFGCNINGTVRGGVVAIGYRAQST